ncbi:MAG: ABC transporter permease [Firmicutes bacterium]|jgi:peptide/nickel transport system permease protein|nr:ABC transporter permease [Bacillota bacterium]
MFNYTIKRLLQSLIVLLGVTIVIFSLIHMAPGDPLIQSMDPSVSAEVREEMLTDMGYYDPIYVQYGKWLGRAITGDLGFSIKFKKPVADVIMEYLPNTILLGVSSLILSIAIAIPAGIVSATKKNSITDYIVTFFSFLGLSIPAFFFGLLLIKWFAYDLEIFPVSGMISIGENYVGLGRYIDILRHLILPAIVLALLQTATLMRYTRSSMIEVIDQDYIRTARAKGVREKVVIRKHAFRNALISIITIITMQIPFLFSGAVLTETIFVWPGIGRINYNAIIGRDYPLIMGIMLLLAVIILLSNFLADIMYAVADPRIRRT